MTTNELRAKAILHIWGWATNMCEGVENGELSDFFNEMVYDEDISKKDALECMKYMQHEADILARKKWRIEK